MARYSRRQALQRGFSLAGLSLVSGCGQLSLPGQQPKKVPRIGFLGTGARAGRQFLIDGLLEGLREHGYVEAQNIVIEYRFSDGQDDRLLELAADLVHMQVELIVASGAPASFAAKQATDTIPIVMGGIAADPVETGLVVSLARPGGNVTGMYNLTSQLSGKRLELLKEIVPGLSRVAVFWNPPNPAYGPVLKELEAAAKALVIGLQRLEVRVPGDFEGALQVAISQRADALIMPADPLTTNQAGIVADLALKYGLPSIMDIKEMVAAGGLLALGPNLVDSYRRAATHVDKILKGAKPADLPMEQPRTFDLAVNLKTAQALSLTIPQSVLQQATEIIQ